MKIVFLILSLLQASLETKPCILELPCKQLLQTAQGSCLPRSLCLFKVAHSLPLVLHVCPSAHAVMLQTHALCLLVNI